MRSVEASCYQVRRTIVLDAWWIDADRRIHHDDGVTDRMDTYKADTIFTEAGERYRLGKLLVRRRCYP